MTSLWCLLKIYALKLLRCPKNTVRPAPSRAAKNTVISLNQHRGRRSVFGVYVPCVPLSSQVERQLPVCTRKSMLIGEHRRRPKTSRSVNLTTFGIEFQPIHSSERFRKRFFSSIQMDLYIALQRRSTPPLRVPCRGLCNVNFNTTAPGYDSTSHASCAEHPASAACRPHGFPSVRGETASRSSTLMHGCIPLLSRD